MEATRSPALKEQHLKASSWLLNCIDTAPEEPGLRLAREKWRKQGPVTLLTQWSPVPHRAPGWGAGRCLHSLPFSQADCPGRVLRAQSALTMW